MRRSHKVQKTSDYRQSLGAGNLAGQLQHMSARHLPVDVVQDDGWHEEEVEYAAGGHDARRGSHIGSQCSGHFLNCNCETGGSVIRHTFGKKEIMFKIRTDGCTIWVMDYIVEKKDPRDVFVNYMV